MLRFLTLPHIQFEFHTEYLLLVTIAFLLSLLLAFLLYRHTNPPVSGGLKRFLFVLRFLALFILLALVLEPAATLLFIRHERPVVAVVVDGSASMTIADREGNRQAVLDSLLRSETIEQLSANYDLKFYEFTDGVHHFTPDQRESLGIGGRVTNIGGALQAVRDSLENEHLQSFLLVTDGGNNVGQDPGRVAQSLEYPVFTIGIGDSTELKDVALVKLVTNEVTYTGKESSVVATIRSSGLGEKRVPVTLQDSNSILDSKHLLLSASGGEQVITLQYTPQEEGTHKYTVSVPLQEGETITQNNSRKFVVRVLQSKIRVLIVAGSPQYECTFLKRTLEQDEDIEVTLTIPKKEGGYYDDALPAHEDDLNEFDALILLAVPRSVLGQSVEDAIVDFVANEGKALLMVPGRNAATWTRYSDSPIADMLPVQILTARDHFHTSNLIPLLTVEGLSHPVTRLDEDVAANERKWSDMPPLLGAVKNCRPKPEAMILSTYPQIKSGESNTPFIALQRFEKGKTMVINGLPLWRWHFMFWSIGKSAADYVQFITNAVRWLTTQEESDFVTITTGKKMYRSGEQIDFSAQVYDEQYRALDGAEVVVTIAPQDTSRDALGTTAFNFPLLQKGDGWGRYEGTLKTLPPGDFQYTGTALFKGRSLGRASGVFSIEEYSMEFENTRMNVDLLRRLAETSGGKYLHYTSFHRLNEVLKGKRRVRSEHRPLVFWDNPVVLGVLLLFVFTEWTIRKRKGMM